MDHCFKTASTNPDELLIKQPKRRSAVVGIFPNRAAVIRLFGAPLTEQNDERLVGKHDVGDASVQALLRPRAG